RAAPGRAWHRPRREECAARRLPRRRGGAAPPARANESPSTPAAATAAPPAPPPPKTPAATTPSKGGGERAREVVIAPRDVFSEVVNKNYGRSDLMALDFVKAANPELSSIDKLRVGQRLRLPALEPPSLVQQM